MKKTVFKSSAAHFHAIGQKECALKLARGYAAVKENAVLRVVGLLSAHNKLTILNRNRQVLISKASDRKRYAKRVPTCLFDIVGRISVVGFGGPFDQPFKLIKAQQKGVRPKGKFGHFASSIKATL